MKKIVILSSVCCIAGLILMKRTADKKKYEKFLIEFDKALSEVMREQEYLK
jgi:hypothetical protein